jgi:putative redox protein
MSSVQVSWRPGTARFVARGASGAAITVAAPDEPAGVSLDDGPHGREAGPGPAELLLVAGGTCAAWDVVEILRKARQHVTGIDVAVDGEQEEEAPWTFRRVTLRFSVRGRGLAVPKVERAVALSVERYCSVLSTVAAAAEVEHRVEVVEDSSPA